MISRETEQRRFVDRVVHTVAAQTELIGTTFDRHEIEALALAVYEALIQMEIDRARRPTDDGKEPR